MLLIFYKRCLLLHPIILKLAKKYLVLPSLEEQYLNLEMHQELFNEQEHHRNLMIVFHYTLPLDTLQSQILSGI